MISTYFVENDGHGEPTLWRRVDDPTDPYFEPEDPHPVIRRRDVQDPDLNWSVIRNAVGGWRVTQ